MLRRNILLGIIAPILLRSNTFVFELRRNRSFEAQTQEHLSEEERSLYQRFLLLRRRRIGASLDSQFIFFH